MRKWLIVYKVYKDEERDGSNYGFLPNKIYLQNQPHICSYKLFYSSNRYTYSWNVIVSLKWYVGTHPSNSGKGLKRKTHSSSWFC